MQTHRSRHVIIFLLLLLFKLFPHEGREQDLKKFTGPCARILSLSSNWSSSIMNCRQLRWDFYRFGIARGRWKKERGPLGDFSSLRDAGQALCMNPSPRWPFSPFNQVEEGQLEEQLQDVAIVIDGFTRFSQRKRMIISFTGKAKGDYHRSRCRWNLSGKLYGNLYQAASWLSPSAGKDFSSSPSVLWARALVALPAC